MRFGTVALVGRTNVGKSTFLNAALGVDLAITSRLPQTTRDALLGVLTTEDAQIAFVDTPGLHRPRNELGRRMNAAALQAARDADVLVFMTDRLGLDLSVLTLNLSMFGAELSPEPGLRSVFNFVLGVRFTL